jgi:hypothetical protein
VTDPVEQPGPVQAALPGSPEQSTGDERVDAALASLVELDTAPPPQHAAVIEAVHDQLRAVLAGLDAGEQSGGPEAGRGTPDGPAAG